MARTSALPRRSRRKALTDVVLAGNRDLALARDLHTCQAPSRLSGLAPCAGGLHVHHVLPRSRGGGHALENLLTLCQTCHAYVHGHPALAKPAGLLA